MVTAVLPCPDSKKGFSDGYPLNQNQACIYIGHGTRMGGNCGWVLFPFNKSEATEILELELHVTEVHEAIHPAPKNKEWETV